MYQLNEMVSHPVHGACKITEICECDVAGKKALYYKLIPCNETKATVFVPVANTASIGLRPLITREQAAGLIESVSCDETAWFTNTAEKQKRYKALFCENSLENLQEVLSVISVIVKRQCEKTLGASDKTMLLNLQNKVMPELAFALDISPEEAIQKTENLILNS